MDIRRALGFSKPRYLWSIGSVGSSRQYYCHAGNLETFLGGLSERLFFIKNADGSFARPLEPAAGAFGQLMPFKYKLLQRLKCVTFERVPRAEFPAYYEGSKRALYERAVQQLDLGGIRRRHAFVSSFVKVEKIFKPLAAPRLIQPRAPEYNVEVGCYLKPLEHAMYACIDSLFGHRVVMKNLNAEQRGAAIADAWSSIDDPVAVGFDMMRFDQSVHLRSLKFEHGVYLAAYDYDPYLKMLLDWQLKTTGYGRFPDGQVKYWVTGSRMSGDMNTALGNVLLVCSMFYSYLERLGVPYRFIDDGDDCLVIISRQHQSLLSAIPDYLRDFGFRASVDDPVDVIEQIRFCQSAPVYDGVGWRVVRDPVASVPKDLLSVQPIYSKSHWDQHRLAISQCTEALAGDMPVIGAFGAMVGRDAGLKTRKDLHQTGFVRLARGCKRKFAEPTLASRESFSRAFGYLPHEQKAIEEQLRAIKLVYAPPPDRIGEDVFPVVDRFTERMWW